jgi:hypothetical protein
MAVHILPNVTRLVDTSEVRRALQLFASHGQVVEIRALKATQDQNGRYLRTYGGYFDNSKDLIQAICTLRHAMGIYITLHPCEPDILHRCKNKLKEQEKDFSTADKNITGYRWLAIDCDPDRVSGISSTDEEHEKALAMCRKIREALRALGWPEPILADSGNGGHLLYRIDQPISDKGLIERVLKGLASQFDEDDVHVDQTMFNPSRIIKLYGTLACKGDNTSERPHRLSRILEVPEEIQIVSRDLLEAMAIPAEEKTPVSINTKQTNSYKSSHYEKEDFTAEAFIAKHGIRVKSTSPYENGTRYLLEACVWDPSHTDNSACIYQFLDGRLGASCSHNSCQGKHWKDFRLHFEPDAYAEQAMQFDDIKAKIAEATDDDTLYDLAEVIAFMPTIEQAKLISAIKSKTEKSKTFSMQNFKKTMSEAIKAKKERERESRRTYSDDTRQYFAEDGCMWINVDPTEHDEDPEPIQISNFTAEIATDILTDDGAEKKRSYEIKAHLRDKQFLFEIQAEELARGEWIDRHLGAKARITVGRQMKDHLAAAIKTCSDAPEYYYYAHTGWRKIDGRMVFLHSGGGLSQESQVSQNKNFDLTHTFLFDKSALQATSHTHKNDMSQVSQVSQVDREYRVKLNGSLSKFDLPIVEDIQKAIRSSLKFVDITRDTITMPLYAALWRAPLGRANFGVHFAGQSGLGKSEISALLQQHFGPGMHANSLPGSWESTENALEMQLFQAKDVLLVCDDFKPKGGKNDQDRLHAKADRVFRSVGNGSTRARLDSHLNQRPERRPRCLLLSTGEDVPRGESLQARVVVLVMTECITKGDASKRLSEAQANARDGLYAQAMSGYIQWLAPRIEAIQDNLPLLEANERDNLVNEGHARLSTNTAHLIIGMKFFLQYAIEMQAITLQEAQTYINRCIDALKKNASDTAIESKSKKPSEQWREMLIAAITSKRAHLVTADGNNPGVEYGWVKRVRDVVIADGTPTTEESFSGGGDQIGWIDGDDIYLLPQLAYKAVRAMSSATGNEITTTESSLRKFLAQDGLLASTDLHREKRPTVTVRRRLQGHQPDVLHLKKEIIFPCVTPLCEKVDSFDSLDTEASRSASEAVSDVSQVFDSNGTESSQVVDSQPKQQPIPPQRACLRCSTQNWQWDEMLEIYTCGGCNHGKN